MFSITRMINIFVQYNEMYLTGAAATVLLAACAVLCGVVIGLFLALVRLAKVRFLSAFAVAYIEFIRATPLLVQVFIIYYGSAGLGLKFPSTLVNAFFWGMLAISMNSGAYIAEIFRSGIGAVDHGQLEAARSIGMRQNTAMRLVVLPQAFRNILPALANEFVTIIKETSIMSFVGIAELMFKTGDVISITWRSLECYIIAALIYFVIVFPLSKMVALLERRLNKSVAR